MLDLKRIIREEISLTIGGDIEIVMEQLVRETVRDEIRKLIKAQAKLRIINAMDDDILLQIRRNLDNGSG